MPPAKKHLGISVFSSGSHEEIKEDQIRLNIDVLLEMDAKSAMLERLENTETV